MSCNNQPTITETIICAKACTVRLNDSPTAKLSYSGSTLSDDSTYFDGNATGRLIRWKVYTSSYFFYDFGWNLQTDIVPELSNGSSYEQMDLGVNNSTILTYFESLPNTIIPNGTQFEILMDVKDSMGVENTNESNKYKFTK